MRARWPWIAPPGPVSARRCESIDGRQARTISARFVACSGEAARATASGSPATAASRTSHTTSGNPAAAMRSAIGRPIAPSPMMAIVVPDPVMLPPFLGSSCIMARGGKAVSARPVPRVLLDSIVAHFNPQRVILFGSQARGDAGPHSDIDLLVVVDDDTPAERLSGGWVVKSRADYRGA